MSATSSASTPATSVTRLAAAEFVGTAIVVIGGPGLLIVGGGDVSRVEFALGFGISTAIAIGVIGAVANPMFSLALWFAKAISGRELAADCVGQVLGAVFGALVLFGLNDATRFTRGVNGYDPGDLGNGIDLGYNLSGFSDLGVVLAAEFVIAVIVVVVLLGSIREQRSNAATAGFVGGAMTLATLFLAPVSGVGINPARSLAMAIFADTDPNALGQVWVFILVPIVAALAGLLVWLAIDDDTIDDTVFDDTFVESAVDKMTD